MRNRNTLLIIILVLAVAAFGGFLVFKPKAQKNIATLVTDKSAISLYHNWTISFTKELTNDDIQDIRIELKDSINKEINCIWTTTADKKAIEVRPPVNGYTEGEKYTIIVKSTVPFEINGESGTEKEISFTPKRAYEDAKVKFEDENLELAVREQIEKPEGELSVSDLESITTLIANDRQIKSIVGIQYLVNLRELYLDVNEISDISSLKGLTYLERLGLSHNQVKDISVLKGVQLKYLALYGNNISDYSVVKDVYSKLEWKDFAID